METTEGAPRIYLVAGEASGDLLGARLMQALRAHFPDATFAGVGGALMQAQGLESLFPMDELSIMGLAEILPRALPLLARIREVARDIERVSPDALITIDAPGFNFRLARCVRRFHKRPLMLHYTAPSVWAWREGRAKKIAKLYDHLLTLFPFEPRYFTKYNLPATFVGHPLIEDPRLACRRMSFRQMHGIRADVPLAVVLPGSRRGELARHGPLFCEALKRLKETHPDLVVVCPTLEALASEARTLFKDLPLYIVTREDEKYACFWDADVALAASGTVTLELALTQTPMVVSYKVHPLSAFIMKFLLKTPFVCLVNILLGRWVVPEILQDDATPESLSAALEGILREGHVQSELLLRVRNLLHPLTGSPSDCAAGVVKSLL